MYDCVLLRLFPIKKCTLIVDSFSRAPVDIFNFDVLYYIIFILVKNDLCSQNFSNKPCQAHQSGLASKTVGKNRA